jgi:hypothetical protein
MVLVVANLALCHRCKRVLLLVVVLVLAWFQGVAYLRLSLALLDVGLRHARGELLVLVVLLGAIDLGYSRHRKQVLLLVVVLVWFQGVAYLLLSLVLVV